MKKWLIIAVLLALLYIFRDQALIGFGHLWYQWFAGRQASNAQVIQGKTERVTFHSDLLKADRTMIIYLPYNYDQVFFSRFPVLYLLHGFAGVPDDWLINAKIEEVIEKLITDGKIPPMIIVMPDGNGPLIKDSEYVDATLVDQPMESHLIKELIPYIDEKYRTLREGSGRALMGISTGGYAAVNLTLRNPTTFHYAISLSGYFVNREWPMDKLIGSNSEARHANEPLRYLDQFKTEEPISLYLAHSEIDFKEFVADNAELDRKLTQKGIDHVYTKLPGVHFWTSWNKGIPDALSWLGGHLRNEL